MGLIHVCPWVDMLGCPKAGRKWTRLVRHCSTPCGLLPAYRLPEIILFVVVKMNCGFFKLLPLSGLLASYWPRKVAEVSQMLGKCGLSDSREIIELQGTDAGKTPKGYHFNRSSTLSKTMIFRKLRVVAFPAKWRHCSLFLF